MDNTAKIIRVCKSAQTPEQLVVAARYLKLAEKGNEIEPHIFEMLSGDIIKQESIAALHKLGFETRDRPLTEPYTSIFIHYPNKLYAGRVTWWRNKYHSHKFFINHNKQLLEWASKWCKL